MRLSVLCGAALGLISLTTPPKADERWVPAGEFRRTDSSWPGYSAPRMRPGDATPVRCARAGDAREEIVLRETGPTWIKVLHHDGFEAEVIFYHYGRARKAVIYDKPLTIDPSLAGDPRCARGVVTGYELARSIGVRFTISHHSSNASSGVWPLIEAAESAEELSRAIRRTGLTAYLLKVDLVGSEADAARARVEAVGNLFDAARETADRMDATPPESQVRDPGLADASVVRYRITEPVINPPSARP